MREKKSAYAFSFRRLGTLGETRGPFGSRTSLSDTRDTISLGASVVLDSEQPGHGFRLRLQVGYVSAIEQFYPCAASRRWPPRPRKPAVARGGRVSGSASARTPAVRGQEILQRNLWSVEDDHEPGQSPKLRCLFAEQRCKPPRVYHTAPLCSESNASTVPDLEIASISAWSSSTTVPTSTQAVFVKI
jgi:hypothetical protein